ncbi:MAG: Lrp/AsnC ligand binding domain-containing protein [Candidatus Rokubacteria bacterium]|nr:Lrp/AsnC ligand binding domain-containing protein [Candidatus Rokubacteria bacterium]
MATQAYVFVYATPGRVEAVARGIARLRGVKSAHMCWGRPDVIAFAEGPNPRALGRLVLRRIQRVRGVEATDTRIVIEA